MTIAKEARKGILSSMHPSVNLLKLTRQLMVQELPDNAHILASGKLCVSLTRLPDRKNVLVSKFSSKDELIQVSGAKWSKTGKKFQSESVKLKRRRNAQIRLNNLCFNSVVCPGFNL